MSEDTKAKAPRRTQQDIVNEALAELTKSGDLNTIQDMADWKWFDGGKEEYSSERIQTIKTMAAANLNTYEKVKLVLEKEYKKHISLKKKEDKVKF
jgi:hypothetical protein